MNPYLHLQIIEQHNALLLAARSHDGATATVPLQLPELDEEAENYGEQLAQALFAGPVRTLYDRCRGAVKGDRRLGIRLALAEVPALDQIRWEWLCLPESRRLLLLDQHTDYVLEPPGLEAIKQRNMGPRQLRMLLVVHSPSEGRGHFEAAPFIDHLANACGEIDFKILAPPESVAEQWQAHYLGRATRHALLEHAGAFSLLHIVAHGSRGTLYLDDGRGGLDRLPPDDLIGHMAHLAEPPQLVFLSSCYSGDGNRHQLARKLVAEAGIPVVIAMRDALPVVLARDLLAPFYRELWRHGQVAKALDHAVLGRGQSRHEPVETVPMVFSRLAGKPLFAQGYYREPTAAELRQGYGKLRELVRERAPDLANHPAVSRHDPLIGEEDLPQLDTLCTRVTDLGFKTLCLGFEPNPQGPNPFPGADPLNEMMEPPGRVDLMKRAWQMLTQRTEGHTLWLSGPAGSGKTSLARGLIHRFRAEIGQPVHQLSEDLPAELAPGLWLCDNPSHIEEILTLPRQRETYLLFVFREGATTLAARPEDHPLLDVPPLRGAALAGALTELATRAGYRVEKALHEAWARESSPRAMTLLARSAQQHWHHRQGAHFPHEAYGQINVAQQVIAAARERWGTPDPDWPLWGPLYRLLTAENQRLSREELLPVTQQTEVVQRLELGLDGGMLAQWESGFQIGNEALAEWPTYQSWLERVAPQLEPLQNLIRRARSWHRHGRKSHDLLPYDDALKKHEAWLEEPRYGRTAIEQAFMEACKTKHRHQTTRRKLALATIIALLSLASIAGVFAYFNAQEARAQKQVAESQRNEAIRHHARYRLERAREYNDRTHYLRIR